MDAQPARDDQRVRSISRGKNGKFPVLSDEGGEVIETCGLKYDVDGQSRELYEAVGSDVARFNGKGGWILPAPAVFVIDRERIVRFVAVNGDYIQRVEPEEALAALDSLES